MMSGPLPELELRIECFMTNPPDPGGIAVCLDGRHIGVVSLEDFDKVVEQLAELRSRRK